MNSILKLTGRRDKIFTIQRTETKNTKTDSEIVLCDCKVPHGYASFSKEDIHYLPTVQNESPPPSKKKFKKKGTSVLDP